MKYTIMHVNDRAKVNMEYNKKILKDFEIIENINYVDGNKVDCYKILKNLGISVDVWNPYDGRKSNPLPGEYGFMVSMINLWQYIVDNKISQILTVEDDVILKKDFVENLNLFLNDLPKDFDFLSLYYFLGQNQETEDLDIQSRYIQKSKNQYSGTQAMVYSYYGAKKMLNLIKRKGMEYTADCFLYRQSLENLINGYSIKGNNDLFLVHDYKNIKSLIDPNNFRETDVL